jgi:hypothetical protein
VLPNETQSNTDIEEDRRAKLLIEIAAPIFTKSSTDTEAPTRAKPKTESDDANRAKHLKDKDDPI